MPVMQTRQVFTAYNRERGAGEAPGRFCPSCGAHLPAPDPAIHRRSCPECGRVQYRNPSPGVVILITADERVLLGRRAASSYAPGQWCLPGGFIEFEEDFLTAAIRETREETGFDVEITSILSVMSNFLREGLHTLVVVLEATIVGGEAVPGDDITELGWFPLEGPFPEMAFEADHHIILRYRKSSLIGLPVDPDYARQKAYDVSDRLCP